MIEATGPFPREERIRRSRDFRALSRRGRRLRGGAFVVLSAAGERSELARLGVTVSRRVGNAVVRNRVKRRIREWFRRVGRSELAGKEIVVIARREAAALGGAATFEQLSKLVRPLAGARR